MTWLGYEVNFDNPNKEKYNSVPVYYCKECLSLKINGEIEELSYCMDCHNADVGLTSIEEWDKMFYDRYGYHYLGEKPKSIYQLILEDNINEYNKLNLNS